MKQAILLVHGMGKFSAPKDGKPGTFGQEFIDATTAGLQQFAKHKGKTLADYVDIHEFNYNEWFEKMQTIMADNATAMKDRIAAIAGFPGAGKAEDLVGQLTGFEANFKTDKFFYTHWLDVIFYGTMLGAKVRVDAAVKVTELVEKYGGANVHIVAHSLGTWVVHDTLHLLYSPNAGQAPRLKVVDHKLGSVWMFANVSRLGNEVTKLINPLKSVVRPAPGGCTNKFFNIRHKLDPFTWPAPFDPADDGSWIPQAAYADDYCRIENRLVLDRNTHSFPRYAEVPEVIGRMLPFVLGPEFQGTPEEFQQFVADYGMKASQIAFDQLKALLGQKLGIPGPVTGWLDFLNTAKAYQDAIDSLPEIP